MHRVRTRFLSSTYSSFQKSSFLETLLQQYMKPTTTMLSTPQVIKTSARVICCFLNKEREYYTLSVVLSTTNGRCQKKSRPPIILTSLCVNPRNEVTCQLGNRRKSAAAMIQLSLPFETSSITSCVSVIVGGSTLLTVPTNAMLVGPYDNVMTTTSLRYGSFIFFPLLGNCDVVELFCILADAWITILRRLRPLFDLPRLEFAVLEKVLRGQ